MALLEPPFVNVEGVRNLRDIGGYQTTPGFCTRRGLIYRSADIRVPTENALQQLKSLGITAVYDLRSRHEIMKAEETDKGMSKKIYDHWKSLPNGPEYNFVPVFEDDEYSPEALIQRFRDYASRGTEVSHLSCTETIQSLSNL